MSGRDFHKDMKGHLWRTGEWEGGRAAPENGRAPLAPREQRTENGTRGKRATDKPLRQVKRPFNDRSVKERILIRWMELLII